MRDGKARPEKNPMKERERRLHTGGMGSSTDTGVSSADTVVESEGTEQARNSDEGWNKRRYQREDEVLWGLEEQDTKSIGMTPVSRTGSGNKYQYYARNPAINDLHPPVVSTQPRDKTETQWMLQPPPKAELMAGKVRGNTPPNRSRSGSGGTNASKCSMGRAPDMSLGRQVSQRLVESKLKRGEQPLSPPPSAAISRGPSLQSNTSAVPLGQPHDRDTNLFPPRFAEPPLPSPPPPRPPLSTISSASMPQKQKDRPPHLRPFVLSSNSTSSLRVLQKIVTPASQLNTVKTASWPLPDAAVQVKLPPVSQQEDADLKLPEVKSWFPESRWDIRGGRKENVGHGHAHRWSMDI